MASAALPAGLATRNQLCPSTTHSSIYSHTLHVPRCSVHNHLPAIGSLACTATHHTLTTHHPTTHATYVDTAHEPRRNGDPAWSAIYAPAARLRTRYTHCTRVLPLNACVQRLSTRICTCAAQLQRNPGPRPSSRCDPSLTGSRR
jgi:hypothetical protein